MMHTIHTEWTDAMMHNAHGKRDMCTLLYKAVNLVSQLSDDVVMGISKVISLAVYNESNH